VSFISEGGILSQKHSDAVDWTIRQGLLGASETSLMAAFCRRAREVGIDIDHAVVFHDTLHPVQECLGYFWSADDSQVIRERQFLRPEASNNAEQWKGSAFQDMVSRSLKELHLTPAEAQNSSYEIFGDDSVQNRSDQFYMIHPLGEPDALGGMDSFYSCWSIRDGRRFSAEDLDGLRQLVPALALGFKSAALRRLAGSLVDVYLGHDAGKRVLEGKIERGRVESINTVIWFSDMRNFTSLSETVDSGQLIAMLDDYAEAAISAVYHAGGDVLKLMGDGTLAIFNQSDPATAARAALSARDELVSRVSRLNLSRQQNGQATTSIYVGLHKGEVFYGNIGSDERLDFTVIGPAVNETSRIAEVCREVHSSLVVSEEFLTALDPHDATRFLDAGTFKLKGVKTERRLFSVEPTI
jgi:adenylate cyclase